MIIKFSVFLLLFTTSVVSFAQKIHMDVIMGEKKVGEINAEKIIKGKEAEYSMKSDVEASMVITVKVHITSKTYWYDGNLTVSRATRNSNMPGQDQTTALEIKGQLYQVTKNNKEKTLAAYPVRLTTTLLYFQEPVKDTAVFSEIQAVYLPIKNLGNHRYQLTQPNGKKDIYNYLNGSLTKIETIIAGRNVEFVVK